MSRDVLSPMAPLAVVSLPDTELGAWVREHTWDLIDAVLRRDPLGACHITDDGPRQRYGELALALMRALGIDPAEELALLDKEAERLGGEQRRILDQLANLKSGGGK